MSTLKTFFLKRCPEISETYQNFFWKIAHFEIKASCLVKILVTFYQPLRNINEFEDNAVQNVLIRL